MSFWQFSVIVAGFSVIVAGHWPFGMSLWRVGFYLDCHFGIWLTFWQGWFRHNHQNICICITQSFRITCFCRSLHRDTRHIYIYVWSSLEIPSSRTACTLDRLLHILKQTSAFSCSFIFLQLVISSTVLKQPVQCPSLTLQCFVHGDLIIYSRPIKIAVCINP